MFEQSGGWLMSKSASSLFSDIELLCGSKDDANAKFTAPPKWEVLASVLGEIKSIPLQESEVPSAGPSVLLLVNNDSVCRQIADLIKSGPKMLSWLVCKQLYDSPEPEPLRTPLWDPDYVIPFARAQAAEDLRTSKNGTKQTRIVQFGILQYKRKKQDLQVFLFVLANQPKCYTVLLTDTIFVPMTIQYIL
uniref:BRCT domain-containing protein n=1 Tax=Heterorhabditis bacteriophora TaxID=37862 RepID=A0A1I7XP54_HETBA